MIIIINVEQHASFQLTNQGLCIKKQNVDVWILQIGSDALNEHWISLLFQKVTPVCRCLVAGPTLNL